MNRFEGCMEDWPPSMHIHLVGIGGSGLSAIARVLWERGHSVSGSDKQANPMTEALAKDGVAIQLGHDAQQIENAAAVIYTSAIDEEGMGEVDAARRKGIPTYRRADIMQTVIGPRPTIAIAGTHGKTTTTAMLVHILRKSGLSPGFILGSRLASGENASVGTDDLFVVEADEYDHMFLGLCPETALITNLELDHPDFFPDLDALVQAFSQFSLRILPGGRLIHCADDPLLSQTVAALNADLRLASYGGAASADLQLTQIRKSPLGCTAICMHQGVAAAELALALVGEHNLWNAAAALLAAAEYGIPWEKAAAALQDFPGVERRMNVRSERAGLAVVDDYAHHPTAIRATIAAARQKFPERQLVVVWQPHTFSRVAALWDGFTRAFQGADKVIVTEIFAAREKPIAGIHGAALTAAILHPRVHFAPDASAALAQIIARLQIPACVLILSAGDAASIGESLLNDWEEIAN